ncbi:hypothetical protein BC831DRAFT_509070 [Entophlyctis helioformis]|nr:hypothetical protein BC831DRAFT_509070 [Entophlyctis helioformis]
MPRLTTTEDRRVSSLVLLKKVLTKSLPPRGPPVADAPPSTDENCEALAASMQKVVLMRTEHGFDTPRKHVLTRTSVKMTVSAEEHSKEQPALAKEQPALPAKPTPKFNVISMPLPVRKSDGYLERFLDGKIDLDDYENLDNNLRCIWNDALKTSWGGDLARLPGLVRLDPDGRENRVNMYFVTDRDMYARLLVRFPYQNDTAEQVRIDKRMNSYTSAFLDSYGHLQLDQQLRHIPMRRGWFELLDFTYPIALGWIAIQYGHNKLLAHLAMHHNVDLAKYTRIHCVVGVDRIHAMDLAAHHGRFVTLQLLQIVHSTACTPVALEAAAKHGYKKIVEWLVINRPADVNVDAVADNPKISPGMKQFIANVLAKSK